MEMFALLLALVLPARGSLQDAAEEFDPSEILSRIFNGNNETQGRAGYRLLGFDNQNLPHTNNGYEGNHIKFEDIGYGGEENLQLNRRKKKRGRKPKKQVLFAQPYARFHPNLGESVYNGPIRRPVPSAASQALSSITQALTSIAKYDDLHCVPRLLCESASSSASGGSQLLQNISGLGPLLTLLSAYSGVSANPLFAFGSAVFLGMSSKGNPASCRYAYSSCPTDPDQLVHYLNNHNGGFFRFFNSPQKQQSLNQFYSHLSPNYQQPNQYVQNTAQQSYGLYKPSLFGSSLEEQYSATYNNYNINRFKNRIEKRIQNTPSANSVKGNSKWKFPERYQEPNFELNTEIIDDGYVINDFKFPDDKDRRTRGFTFPESINTKYYATSQESNYLIYPAHGNDEYVRNDNNHYYTNNDLYTRNNNDLEDGQTVYVVRGNGDPNKPEIIKLKPGQSIREAV